MVMFMGEYRHNLDSKNRLIVPSKFRDQLSTTVYVTEWMDGEVRFLSSWERNPFVSSVLEASSSSVRSFLIRSCLIRAPISMQSAPFCFVMVNFNFIFMKLQYYVKNIPVMQQKN